MQRKISLRKLRNSSAEIMRALDAGESFVVMSNDVPLAELKPLRRQYFVPKGIVLRAFRSAPSIDLDRLRTELDAVAYQCPEPRA